MSELVLTSDARYSDLHNAFAFYALQIVELTATLTLDANGVTDGLAVVFDRAGPESASLNPYGIENVDWYPVDGDGTQVMVYMKQTGPRTGIAKLRVLVVGTTSTPNRLSQGGTSASIASGYRSNEIQYDIFGAGTWATSYPGLLNASEVDQTPSSSQGNYLYFRLQVTSDGSDGETPAFTGLPNMLIRLTASDPEERSDFLTQVLLYTDTVGPPCNVDVSNQTPTVDLVTDATGLAELYVCAKAGETACASVTCDGGVVAPDIGPILVADFGALQSSPAAPHCDNPVDLALSGQTIEAAIPDYRNAAQGDGIFLFCNGRFQGAGILPDALKLPLPFQAASLRSQSPPYSDSEQNALYYVAARRNMISVSSAFPFIATGALPKAVLEAVTPKNSNRLAAPVILEADDGWPINCSVIAGGLTVRIPIDSGKLKLGDVIVVQMALNGYRIEPDESIGMAIPMPGGAVNWPESLVVTSSVMARPHIDWRFQSYHFMGFGQLRSLIGDSGSVGTLECRYTVQRDDGFSYCAYCSETLSTGLDTISPDGRIGLSGWVPPDLI